MSEQVDEIAEWLREAEGSGSGWIELVDETFRVPVGVLQSEFGEGLGVGFGWGGVGGGWWLVLGLGLGLGRKNGKVRITDER